MVAVVLVLQLIFFVLGIVGVIDMGLDIFFHIWPEIRDGKAKISFLQGIMS